MATAKLTLPIEQNIAERIEKYADSRKKTVTGMVESFFSVVTATVGKSESKEISPLIQSFSIDGVNIPADFNYKKELAAARNEKYL
jgi:hypothetical protein